MLEPVDGHMSLLADASMNFSKLSEVQISNPSLISSGDNDQLNDLMYLEGVINGSSHDNSSSSLGAHTTNIGEFIFKMNLLFIIFCSSVRL